jgi:hypothetical protein
MLRAGWMHWGEVGGHSDPDAKTIRAIERITLRSGVEWSVGRRRLCDEWSRLTHSTSLTQVCL